MKFKFNIKREIKIAVVLIVVFGLIAFTERMKGDIAVHDIQIRIENIHGNHFLDESDIADLMQLDHQNLRGASLSKVDFKVIEKRIKRDPFIKNAELFSDLKGNLIVNVELRRPIARIIRNDGPDGYIAEDGTIMPTSEKFTARVMLISGGYVSQMLKQPNVYALEHGEQLLEMINTIREDDFWSAQIAQLDIDSRGKITVIPQVGDEDIEFGKPEDIESKFKKLRIFYKEILPRVGWNKYSRVNLEFEGQIVAE
ncbi:cell division protein FtsQ/DivIB [Chryseosolibacter indicus]|uniref:Cell division protein FtsQ n=1 Tax=Chryseosolibacter indicus TaxID=2782351 RepID=A0ABS5VRS0_9BACT|nr:cell division protein FtsQ [Chryseosolibacter indicus]MBT1704139.1 cell division protein FtsQ [Chryseosolibacter indicus]